MSYYTIPTQNIVYQAEAVVNNKLLNDSNITSNWEYRRYLQNNALNIMKYNTNQSIYTSGNNPYALLNRVEAEQTPFLYTSSYDNRNAKVHNPNTDLRQQYLEQQQFKSRMISPNIPINKNIFNL
jgi:hypothetical protein